MAMIDFLGTGVSYPMRVEGGKLKSSSDEELIQESITIILNTRKGERLMRPLFGSDIPSLVFTPNQSASTGAILDYIKDALEDYESRIVLLDVQAEPDAIEEHRLNISIEYEIRTSNSKHNLVFPFYLEGSK